jgi:pimeloyl-ACP methyl ester carboxylesterase
MNIVRSEDGTPIAFDRSGDGPAIIVVGGALNDRSAAAPLTSALSPRFTVYAYDRRGRGASGDTSPYAVDREIEDIHGLMAEAGGSAFVYGQSSGAVLALEAAARGLATPKLALYEPPFIVDDSRPPVPEDFVARLEELASSGRRGDAVAYFMTEGVGLPVEVVEQMRSAPMWPALEELAHTLSYDGLIMGDTTSGRALPTEWATSVTMPTLVMDGGESPAWQRTAVRDLADLLPNAKRRSLEGQDHGAAPEVLGPVLVEFFAG